jgi:hypothetical protein
MIGGMIGIERGIGIGDIAVGVREGMRGIETGEAVEIRGVVEEAEMRGMMREGGGEVRTEVEVQDGIEVSLYWGGWTWLLGVGLTLLCKNENGTVYERGVGARDAREVSIQSYQGRRIWLLGVGLTLFCKTENGIVCARGRRVGVRDANEGWRRRS